MYPEDNTTGLIDIGGHEVRISSVDLPPYNELIMVEHKKGFWFFGWHVMNEASGEWRLTFDVAEQYWNDDTNMSSFGVRCDHLELTVLLTYNTSQFSSFQEAYSDHYIYCTVGIGFEESVTSSIGVWTLVSALLLFQAPDIHILLNLALVLPIYASIAILIFMLIAELIPG